MFSKEQLEKLKHMGSSGLTTKLAQHDGYYVEDTDSPEKQMISLLGQKYFTKKASLKTIAKGLGAMEKLGAEIPDYKPGFYSSRINPTFITKVAISKEILEKLLTKVS